MKMVRFVVVGVHLLPNVSFCGTHRCVSTRRIGIAQMHFVAANVNNVAIRMQIERLLKEIYINEVDRFDCSGSNVR